MADTRVFAVTINFNNAARTIQWLESMAAMDQCDLHVIVIDNASEAEDRARLSAFFAECRRDRWRLLLNENNTGYTGNNLGIHHALAQGASYVLVMNNDTTPAPDLIARLLKAASSARRPGVFAPAIDEGSRVSYGGFIRWFRPDLAHNYDRDRTDIAYVTGACVLIDRRVVEAVGLLDERFFLYFEDADYCLRVRRAGFAIEVVRDAVVHHEVSHTTRHLDRAVLAYYRYRNAHLFALKHAPLHRTALLPVWSLYVLLRRVLMEPPATAEGKGITAAVIDFYRGRFGKSRLHR